MYILNNKSNHVRVTKKLFVLYVELTLLRGEANTFICVELYLCICYCYLKSWAKLYAYTFLLEVMLNYCLAYVLHCEITWRTDSIEHTFSLKPSSHSVD